MYLRYSCEVGDLNPVDQEITELTKLLCIHDEHMHDVKSINYNQVCLLCNIFTL